MLSCLQRPVEKKEWFEFGAESRAETLAERCGRAAFDGCVCAKCIKICVQLETKDLALILRGMQVASFANADAAQL